jgi:hypothetical protein
MPQQEITALLEKSLTDGHAIFVGETREAGIAGNDGRECHRLQPGGRKARDWQAAGHDSHVESRPPAAHWRCGWRVRYGRSRADAGRRRRSVGALMMLSAIRPRTAGLAGRCLRGSRNGRARASAASPSRCRKAGSRIAISSACSKSGRIVRPDQKAVFTIDQQFGHAGNGGGDARQALARRLDQNIRQSVPVAVGGDTAGQREHVGAAVVVEHLLLRQRTFPGDPVRKGRARQREPSASTARRRRRYARNASSDRLGRSASARSSVS